MKVLFIGGIQDRKIKEIKNNQTTIRFSIIDPIRHKTNLNSELIIPEFKYEQYEIHRLSKNCNVGVLLGVSLEDTISTLIENYAKPELRDTNLTIYSSKLYVEKCKKDYQDERIQQLLEKQLGFKQD